MLIQAKESYYSNVSTVFLKAGCKTAFLGKHRWNLQYEPVACQQDCLVSAADLATIFSPDFEQIDTENGIKLRLNGMEWSGVVNQKQLLRTDGFAEPCSGNAQAVELSVPIQRIDGQLFLPVGSFFQKVLHVNFAYKSPFYMVSDTQTEIDQKKDWMYMQTVLAGKKTYGSIYEAFWFEPAKRIVPYRLYVPTSYRPGTPNRLIVGLHGAKSDHHAIFERSNGLVEQLSEERGYLFLGINGLYFRSFYGYTGPTSGGVDSQLEIVDPSNPLGLTERQLQQRALAQECAMETLKLVMEHYAVDPGEIFMMGNSMGGAGTVWLAGQYPEKFRAISPSGGNVDPRFFQVERLKSMPVFFVVGTEDEFGAYHQDVTAEAFIQRGCDYQMYHVGGGTHSYGWVGGLRKTFDFFDRY